VTRRNENSVAYVRQDCTGRVVATTSTPDGSNEPLQMQIAQPTRINGGSRLPIGHLASDSRMQTCRESVPQAKSAADMTTASAPARLIQTRHLAGSKRGQFGPSWTPQTGDRRCTRCLITKPVSTGFRRRVSGKVASWCIECKREHDRGR
jgi:hypothetical protein